MTAFAALGLSESTLQALQDVGYEKPSPIQEQAIPPLLNGGGIIRPAPTGSGKNAALGPPVVRHGGPAPRGGPGPAPAPAREPSLQVAQAPRPDGARQGG